MFNSVNLPQNIVSSLSHSLSIYHVYIYIYIYIPCLFLYNLSLTPSFALFLSLLSIYTSLSPFLHLSQPVNTAMRSPLKTNITKTEGNTQAKSFTFLAGRADQRMRIWSKRHWRSIKIILPAMTNEMKEGRKEEIWIKMQSLIAILCPGCWREAGTNSRPSIPIALFLYFSFYFFYFKETFSFCFFV